MNIKSAYETKQAQKETYFLLKPLFSPIVEEKLFYKYERSRHIQIFINDNLINHFY